MTLEKARQLLQAQVSFGGGYNRHGARLILADVIREMLLDQLFGFQPGAAP